MADLKAAMAKFASKKTEATSKELTKWFTDAKVLNKKNCTSQNLDIAISKYKKTAKTLQATQMKELIAEVAKAYSKDHNMSPEEADTKITDCLKAAEPCFAGATKGVKAGGVDRLTDTSKYTGAHKERFDESGKGKGIGGRQEVHASKGYVGNYKGDGSYDKTH